MRNSKICERRESLYLKGPNTAFTMKPEWPALASQSAITLTHSTSPKLTDTYLTMSAKIGGRFFLIIIDYNLFD